MGFLGVFWYLQIVKGSEFALARGEQPAPSHRAAADARRRARPQGRGPRLDAPRAQPRARPRRADRRRGAAEAARGFPRHPVRHAERALAWRCGTGRRSSRSSSRRTCSFRTSRRSSRAASGSPPSRSSKPRCRDYPDGPAIAHAVGYVGEINESQLAKIADGSLQQGDIVGKTGVEREYDEILRGRRGWRLQTVNSLGRPFGASQPGRDPTDGLPLHLTIDKRLQRKLVEALADEVGSGIFMDPHTGEVLALASTPGYDPNLFTAPVSRTTWTALIGDPRHPLNDRAISSFYAPGSTFKVLMSIVGLETGAITPGTTVSCSGSAMIYNRRFMCWKKGGHGTVDVHHALVQSCNVFYYLLGRKVGIDAISKYAKMFHVGEITGIDIPGESRGNPPSAEWKQRIHKEQWYPGDTISVSIGQGLLAVTPVQMATMISAVANGGSLVRPHLARDTKTEPVRLPVSAERSP